MAAATTDRPNAADQHDGFFRNALELISAGWSYIRARFELATLEGREAVGRYLKALVIVLGAVVIVICASAFPAIAHWLHSRRQARAGVGNASIVENAPNDVVGEKAAE